ncbi:TNF receptor-associated factor homolog 1a-like [Phragmites australis]|uniref:TNF receptor-associated factor homolog 1a-like n=1 Tax=Phragmites australis TaxID=29695 RepID=UPI002D787481|nr:TNF receptor-associated factor homolog 1a-like [Phragmites australis]XP_062202163.1 TNF receptor-associated factor homolog 1a-like [Phragmites australis]XP_062202164.1 TNF receptor-associated factor homolog 1a-like [Phragmites australis]
MAGTWLEDSTGDGRSSSTEELQSDQQSHSGDSLAEWRSSEQVENGTPSTSPAYSDTDEDDCGPRPSELYGKFTWRIDNFSQINKRELRSNSFDVGGFKWYILIYPQGCDVCNHLSLFLCVANHDKLLPGWSHFAQFTIAVINRDPKKSKYSDTLHRFWKKEHDWGWKKFMELSKLHDGFVIEDVLTIKAQVQVIREKIDRPFRCLDGQYRRELIRVYLSNVEQICRRFIDERRSKLSRLIEDKLRWSSFSAFWLGMDPSVRRHMTREKTDTILKVLVKHFFIEKEVTSTLVIDSLYSGLKALEYQSKNKKGVPKLTETDARSTPILLIDQDMFVLADDVILLLERAALDTLPHQPLPAKDDKSSQNRTKDGSSGEEFNKDSIERDDRRLTELGWKTLELFALAHIFSRIEVAYQEAVALRRQEELIREEEAAGLAEIELKAKRSAAEKEKRARKKQAKQKKNSRKSNKGKNGKSDMTDKEILMCSSPSDDRILGDFSRQAEEMSSNADNPEEVSDISDNRDDHSEALHVDIEDRESSPVNWETDASETQATVPDSVEVQNDQAGKRTSFVDDSSSTCSSDSVPSVILNGSYTGGAWTNVRSSSNRGNNRRNKDTDARAGLGQGGANSVHNGIMGSGSNASGNSKDIRHESEDDKVVLQKKQHLQRHVDVMSLSKLRIAESSFSSVSPVKKQPNLSQQPKVSLECTNSLNYRASEVSGAVTATAIAGVTSTLKTQLISNKGPLSSPASRIEKSVPVASRPLQVLPSKSEAQKQTSLVGSATTTQVITVSRPLSAPQVPAAKQSAPVTSTVRNVPLLSRSMSALGPLGNEPSVNAPSYIPRSRTYRNAMMEKSSVSGSGFSHQPGSSEQGVAHSQSVFTSQPSILPSENLPKKEETSLRPGFTFGTVKPESLNQYQCREESSQQASNSSSSGIDCVPSSLNIGSEIEKLNLQRRSRSKQLLSEISTRFTPYQPQGLVGDEFPHLDIINDLLDEEQSDRRKALQQHQQGFVRQYSMPNDASTPNYGLFGDPYLYDQSEQYFDEEPPMFYSPLGSAPRGQRDRSYSHFDLPSYSNSGQFDDMMMNQWPYSRTELSMPNFGSDTSGYSYQSRDYPSSANGASRYPSYRPANGH